MAISDDWNVDYITRVISHIDGTIDYENNAGTAPVAGDYIRGSVSLTTAKILTGTDLGGTSATGTFTLTNVSGLFDLTDELTVLDSVNFDTVVNGGFSVGDTLVGAVSTGQIIVYAIEYNFPYTAAAGGGTIWGIHSGSNLQAEALQLSATTVCNATGTQTDGATFTGADMAALLTPPSGSDCSIINFDTGTALIPRFCKIQDTGDGSPNKTAVVQKVYGVTVSGSLRIIDTTGTAWADNDPIYVVKIPYDNVETGQKFKVGDKVVIKTPPNGATTATGKVISVESAFITLQKQSGTPANNDEIYVRTTTDTLVALVNASAGTEFYVQYALQSGAEITSQLATQGGIYDTASLNIIRDSNSLYTFLQDQFDELSALDDEVPISAQVALQQFTLINSWKIPDLSYRFLESGSIQDEALDNIWTNYQTLGTVAGIGDDVYAAVTPLPQFYIEQNGSVIDAWWYYGHIDVLVKVKTNTDPTSTDTADGVLINSGTVTIFNRNFTHTYDHFQTTTIAGVAPVPLATSLDSNNESGTHFLTFSAGTTSQPLTVGEEIVAEGGTGADPTKRGIVVTYNSLTGPDVTGEVEYVLTGTTQFADTDEFTGQYTGYVKTVNGAPTTTRADATTTVAGLGTKIVIATIDYSVAGTLTTPGFIGGETVTSSDTGTAIFMGLNSTDTVIYLGNATSDFNVAGSDTINGATGVFTAGGGQAEALTIDKDISDGNGLQPYKAVIFLNRDDDTEGDTLANMYEWVKYRTRSLETAGEPEYNLLGGPGNASGVQGRIYITLSSTYPLVKVSPLGTFAGGTFFGAQGVFVQNMANADIRNYQLIDANGVPRNPPNQQTLAVTGVVSGDRVAVFRTSGGNIQDDEFTVGTVGGGNNENGNTTILVAVGTRTVSPLPYDIPDTGVIRVRNNSTLLYESHDYTSVDKTTNIFTISPALTADLTFGENVFVPLIEQEATSTSISKNIEYKAVAQGGDGDVSILTRVRRKGILPFEVSGTFGSSGASVAAIRTFDSIVD
jgi:hypothetical protein